MSKRDDSENGSTHAAEWTVLEQRMYEPDDGPDLTTVVIEAVAAAEGKEITSIKEPSLYEAVDITAVKDALFGARLLDERGVAGGSLDFEYRGFRITLRGDGWVQVAEPADR